MTSTIAVDDLQFEVRWSDQRRTVGLTVDREGELVISAPTGCGTDVLETFVREKRFWLYSKLAEKEALKDEVRPRQFVGGEGFPYLGRSYRLQLVDEQDVPLKLEHGRFHLRRAESADGRRVFIRWYAARGKLWLDRRVARFVPRVGAAPASVEVRDLGFRWGSCARNRSVSFHWAMILLPPAIIDYVIVHELVHLRELNHTTKFWSAVERVLGDYRERRDRLRSLGMQFARII